MKNYIVLLLVSFITFSSFSQELSQGNLNNDLAYLKEVLYTSHPATFDYITKDSLDNLFSSLKFVSNDKLTALELQKRVRIILSQIGCIHTSITKSNFDYKKGRIPFKFFTKESKIWVIKSHNENFPYAGYEVLDINKHSSAEMMHSFKDFRASDGYNQTFKNTLINHTGWFDNLYQYYYDTDSTKTYTLVSPELDTISITLNNTKPIKVDKKTDHKKNGISFGKNIIVKLDSINNIAIMKIKSFSGMAIFGKSINKKHYKKAIKYTINNGFKNLVIDLRGNGGGDGASGPKLLSFFVEKDHYYEIKRHKGKILKHAVFGSKIAYGLNFLLGNLFASRRMTFKARTTKAIVKKNNYLEYKGKVFVITDGFTASTASNVASTFKELTDAIMVGTDTGGASNNLNAYYYAKVKLPSSKIKIKIPQYRIDLRLRKNDGQGVTPDITVDYTIEDIITKKDLEMESIINTLKLN